MSDRFTPPKPRTRPEGISRIAHIRRFKTDLFASQPERLFRAWMAEFKLPFFRSFFVNQPDIIEEILKRRPDNFPKSRIIGGALHALLGRSVFVTNGAIWKRQRRIIDPSFEGGRLHRSFDAMIRAGQQAVREFAPMADGRAVEIEEPASRLAADIIFRTLFSIPITSDIADQTYKAFHAYQRTQPLMNLGSFVRSPWVIKVLQKPATKHHGAELRRLLMRLTDQRALEIQQGSAPDDLATKIMTTKDPETGDVFDTDEMVDQVAIFFLAGHETSASALAWSLYLVAKTPEVQEKIAKETRSLGDISDLKFRDLSKLPFTRDVFREALRLYPPVPMMVREAGQPEFFRNRRVPKGSQMVVSPFHIQRHERIWTDPHVFDPARWQRDETKIAARAAYLPFSTGPRVCTGAGFAMAEGVAMLACLLGAYEFKPVAGREPQPVAHLTLRSEAGIYLSFTPR
ncbi:MAG: cytochrome P450 [Pseudomonadota bacterium]